MPSIASLISNLADHYPALRFTPGEVCDWHPDSQTITYRPDAPAADILHEVGHALLGHADFSRDIQLLAMERDAWEHARTVVAPRYGLTIDETTVDTALDSYRDWLHARSQCPSCSATGVQTARQRYRCLACQTEWRVNDARQCALRRYSTKNPAT